MATRPVFIPGNDRLTVTVRPIDFAWHPGLSATQKKKSVVSLHDAAKRQLDLKEILEISTKSENAAGVELSAFNLSFITKKNRLRVSVESAFQGSKVLSSGGPYSDLYGSDSKSAKIDVRIRNGGRLLGFEFFGVKWPLNPVTAFYDWIYLNALQNNPELASELEKFDAFTDIEFNPEKSLNCQAYSAALYVSLKRANLIEEALRSREYFLETVGKIPGYGVTSSRALGVI